MKKTILFTAVLALNVSLFAGFPEDYRAAQNEFKRSRWASAAEKFLALEKTATGESKSKVLHYAAISLTRAKKAAEAQAVIERIADPAWKGYTQIKILNSGNKLRDIKQQFGKTDFSTWPEDIAYQACFIRGRAYYVTERNKALCIPDLEKAVAGCGSDFLTKIIALDMLASAAHTVKDYEKALKAADQAIVMKQYRGFYAYMSAAYLKAKILAEQKKFAEAEQFLADFNKGRKWGKGQIWHFKYIETCGDVALAKGDIAKAKEYYNQALALEKINPYYVNQLKAKVSKIK